jgi:hypothetical protein
VGKDEVARGWPCHIGKLIIVEVVVKEGRVVWRGQVADLEQTRRAA